MTRERSRRRSAAAAWAAGLAAALGVGGTAALADTVLRASGRALTATSEDAAVRNAMTLDQVGGDLRLSDESDPFGMSGAVPPCRPTRLNDRGNATEYRCPRGSFDSVSIVSGPAEDRVEVRLSPDPARPLAVAVEGEGGADTVVSGDTDDAVSGGQGNDSIASGGGRDELDGGDGDDAVDAGPGDDRATGGPGADRVDGGAGADTISAGDGSADTVACGDGSDAVTADTLDRVAADCETVRRSYVTPAGEGPIGDDRRPPRAAAGGSTSQRVGPRRRWLKVAATSSEEGELAMSGFLDVGGINVPLRARPRRVAVAGGGVTFRVRLSRRVLRLVLRDLRRGRPVVARVRVVATDRAGNTSRLVALRIRLRR